MSTALSAFWTLHSIAFAVALGFVFWIFVPIVTSGGPGLAFAVLSLRGLLAFALITVALPLMVYGLALSVMARWSVTQFPWGRGALVWSCMVAAWLCWVIVLGGTSAASGGLLWLPLVLFWRLSGILAQAWSDARV